METDEDVILVAEGAKFPANKATLMASSDYFRAMFSSGMRETSQVEVEIHGVTSSGLDKALQFVSTTRLDLTLDTVPNILTTASYLQMTSLVQHCRDYLLSTLDISNCLTVYDIGQEFDLGDVCISVEIVLRQRFTEILASDVLVHIPFKLLLSVLSSDELLADEKDVFSAACKWLYHDGEGRAHQSGIVLQAVRFPLMTQSVLDDVGRSAASRDYPECAALLEEAAEYHADVYGQPLRQSPRTALRGAASHVVVAESLMSNLPHGLKSNILCYSIGAKRSSSWQVLTNMAVRAEHSMAVLGNFLFLAGGLGAFPTEVLTSVHRYDPRTDQWLGLRNMNQPRMQFCLVSLSSSIYAVGGLNMDWRLDTVERLDIRNNRWTFCSRLPQPCSGHAAAVCSGRLYVCGGISSAGGVQNLGAFLAQMVCYDPDRDCWAQKAPMAIGRAFHSTGTVRGAVYVAGGGNALLQGTLLDVSMVEKYDPAADQWTKVNSMATPRAYMGVVTTPTEMFLLGGRGTWEGLSHAVQRYRPEENILEEVGEMRLPETVSGAVGCVLELPCIKRPSV